MSGNGWILQSLGSVQCAVCHLCEVVYSDPAPGGGYNGRLHGSVVEVGEGHQAPVSQLRGLVHFLNIKDTTEINF